MCNRTAQRHPAAWLSTAAACTALFLTTGCASTPDLTIHESARGAVYLERVSDKSFHAAHPIKLSPDLIVRVLRGVHVQDDTIQALFASQPKTMRAFADEDVVFLAPLLSTAFSQAAADQQVGFRIITTGSPSYSEKVGAAVGSSEPPLSLSPKETTQGSIYAYGLSLYLTMTEYRHRPQKPDTISGPNRYYPDPSGLARLELFFLPANARRPDTYRQSSFSGDSSPETLVIDYELLAKLPDQPPAIETPASAAPLPATVPGLPKSAEPTAPTGGGLPSVKEPMTKQDAEIEGLKKELQEIKRQLAEQQSKANGGKRKGKPAPKTQEPAP